MRLISGTIIMMNMKTHLIHAHKYMDMIMSHTEIGLKMGLTDISMKAMQWKGPSCFMHLLTHLFHKGSFPKLMQLVALKPSVHFEQSRAFSSSSIFKYLSF